MRFSCLEESSDGSENGGTNEARLSSEAVGSTGNSGGGGRRVLTATVGSGGTRDAVDRGGGDASGGSGVGVDNSSRSVGGGGGVAGGVEGGLGGSRSRSVDAGGSVDNGRQRGADSGVGGGGDNDLGSGGAVRAVGDGLRALSEGDDMGGGLGQSGGRLIRTIARDNSGNGDRSASEESGETHFEEVCR